jgi:ankyrin repeat protein
MAQLLIDHGAVVDARHMGKGTPLHTAADNGSTAVAGTLLLAGAEVDLVDKLGNTPLLLAAMNGHADTVRLLLQFGANAGYVSPVGRFDAQALARKYGHAQVLEVLRAQSV